MVPESDSRHDHPHRAHDPVHDDTENSPLADRLTMGSAVAAGCFVLVSVFAYLLTTAARFGGTAQESDPSTPVFSGFVFLVSHGGTFTEAVDNVPLIFGGIGLAAIVLVPLAAITFVIAGYVLARHVRPKTVPETVTTALTIAPAYVLLTVALATWVEHTPEGDNTGGPGQEVEELTIGTDAGLILTTLAFVTVFASLGALVAVRSSLLESNRTAGQSATADSARSLADPHHDRSTTDGVPEGAGGDQPPTRLDDAHRAPTEASRATTADRGSAGVDDDSPRADSALRSERSSSRDHSRYKPRHLRESGDDSASDGSGAAGIGSTDGDPADTAASDAARTDRDEHERYRS